MGAQQTLPLPDRTAADVHARRAMEDRLREIGVRPPTRYEVTPEDLAPPVKPRTALAALFVRTVRRFWK